MDQLPDPPRKLICVMVSFEAIFVGDEEKLLVVRLVPSFGQADLGSLDQTNQAILRHVSSQVGEDNWDNQLCRDGAPLP